MYLCAECYLQGYCRELNARLVTDAEIANANFVVDLRDYAHALGLGRDKWLAYLLDSYRDYPGRVIDANGVEISLNTEVFDRPNIRYWFRDFACLPRDLKAVTRVRCEARERVRVMATILRAIDPIHTRLWGVRAANDDHTIQPTMVALRASSCPYRNLDRVGVLLRRPVSRLTTNGGNP